MNAAAFPISLCEKINNLPSDDVVAIPQRRREMQETFRRFWSIKIMNDTVGELKELDDLDPIVRIFDVGGKRIYDYTDDAQKEALRTRLIASGRQYGVEYQIEDQPSKLQLKVANVVGLISTMITQKNWYLIFKDIKSDSTLRAALNTTFQATEDTNRIELLDQVRTINSSHNNHLTKQNGNAINAFLAIFSIDDYISIVSLNHRKMIIEKLGLGQFPGSESYGTRIIKSNSLVLSINDKCPQVNPKLHPSTISKILYDEDIKKLWWSDPEEPAIPPEVRARREPIVPPHSPHPQYELLAHELQIIFYGPPGTGKTYQAEQLADYFLREKNGVADVREFRHFVQFHPSYSYEDFIEGLMPQVAEDRKSVYYKVRDGIFKQVCEKALKMPHASFVVIIDEINRGNIPKIFGELLYAIEKRGKPVSLPYSQTESFIVPDNVFVIGTMNTADKSIALIDVALRRRFAFVELMPDPEQIDEPEDFPFPLKLLLITLNNHIVSKYDRERQIGHTYLIGIKNLRDFRIAWFNRIIPLLQEYFYGDFKTLAELVGNEFIDWENQRVNDQLGDDELVQAITRHIESTEAQ